MAGDEITDFRKFQKQLMRRSINTIKALCDEMAAEIDAEKDDSACDTLATLIVITDQLGLALVDYSLKNVKPSHELRELFGL